MRRILAILLLTLPVQAANFFVTPTGAGAHSGTDWNNSFANFSGVNWAAISGGDTLWVAGNNGQTNANYYDQIVPSVSGAIGNPISIKRATAADAAATSSPGWSAGYDSTAYLSTSGNWAVYLYHTDNITLDGRTPNGIRIFGNHPLADPNDQYACVRVVANNITVRYVEAFTPRNGDIWYASLHFGESGSGLKTNLVVQHCYFHGGPQGIFGGLFDTVLVEDSEIYDIGMVGSPVNHVHPNPFYCGEASRVTFRRNKVHFAGPTGVYLSPFSAVDYYYVYANLFYDMTDSSFNGILCDPNSTAIGPHLYFNGNTFWTAGAAVRMLHSGTRFPGPQVLGAQLYDNIYYNTSINTEDNPVTRDYNRYTSADAWSGSEPHSVVDAANPFVNVAAFDFHLSANTAPGFVLPSPFNIDYDGNARDPAAWSMGAYQFLGSGPPTPSGNISFGSATYSTTEAGPSVNVTVNRTGSSFGFVSANYATSDGSAVAGHDYTSTSGVASFADGSTNPVVVTIPIINSGDVALTNRTFSVSLSNPSTGATLTNPSIATITITMNPPTIPTVPYPTFNAGLGLVQPTIAVSGTGITNTTQFSGLAQYNVVIPSPGQYYLTASVNAPGDASNSWWVDINRDPRSDDQRCWDIVNFTTGFETRPVGWRGSGAFDQPQFVTNIWTLAAGTNTLWVGGREPGAIASFTFNQVTPPPPPPYAFLQWSAASISAFTFAQTIVATVNRTVSTTNVSTVNFATIAGSALPGVNYTATSGTLTFAVGETSKSIPITILNDPVYQGTLYFLVGLSSPDAGSVIQSPVNLLVTLSPTANGPGTIIYSGRINNGNIHKP